MSLKSPRVKALGIVLAIAWMLGPCQLGAMGLALAAMADGEHEVMLSEGSEDTLITLKHHAENADSEACSKRHHHSAMVAWLLQGQASRDGQHPDHQLKVHHGHAIGTKDRTATTLPEDANDAVKLPAVCCFVLDSAPLPLADRTSLSQRLAQRRYIPPSPARPVVLQI